MILELSHSLNPLHASGGTQGFHKRVPIAVGLQLDPPTLPPGQNVS